MKFQSCACFCYKTSHSSSLLFQDTPHPPAHQLLFLIVVAFVAFMVLFLEAWREHQCNTVLFLIAVMQKHVAGDAVFAASWHSICVCYLYDVHVDWMCLLWLCGSHLLFILFFYSSVTTRCHTPYHSVCYLLCLPSMFELANSIILPFIFLINFLN